MATSEDAVTPSTRTSASGLHMVRHMKLFAVTMLAVIACSACGVGADEIWDGEKLVAANGQALEQGSDVTPGAGRSGVARRASNLPQVPVTTTPSPIRDPGTVALPQDPIPVFEGKPVFPPSTPPYGGATGPIPSR